ncbi:hypothetical protein [Stenotrophomonas tuberculopleuritidis]|uniref:hypothetical protein n=1 Tax=Stenotrophomonas tuberculopleuritidis TaxID=3055079 RepID=UPI0026E5289C|nr:hypothetical protein [Stenotrophomonas sp. 704A1]
MRSALWWMMPLTLLGCSNPPPAASTAPSAAASVAEATAAPELQPNPDSPAQAAAAGVDPLYAAVAAGSESPATLLNRYMLDLLNHNRAGSDAAWAYAPADPQRADDAVLRRLPDVRSLRLDSQTPLARDTTLPPRLLEVPVSVRAVTAQGTFRYHGWYRVQPSADGRAWRIQSAQLQPTLD